MSVLNTSKLTFFQNGAEPLKSGYIYVGQPNTDPQVTSNQKTVTLTDSQGNEFTAAQPLRTNSDGQISYNGKAITATVDGDYSLLVLNSNQVQINGGWTPNISAESEDSVDSDELRIYGLTLSDIKQLDVSVGQTVGNIGSDSATDGDGADWVVVSNTGDSADDKYLIDFDNGLQGRRVSKYVSESASDPWGFVPYVRSGGVMSIGDTIAFTNSSGDTSALYSDDDDDGLYWKLDKLITETALNEALEIPTLVSGSVRIWCDGYNDDDAMYYSQDGDNFTTRTAICKAAGTITVWADFSGGTSDPQCYVRRNGTTMATWSSIVGSSYSTSFSVSVGDVIYLRSNTFAGDTLTLDRWEIRSNSTEHIGLII